MVGEAVSKRTNSRWVVAKRLVLSKRIYTPFLLRTPNNINYRDPHFVINIISEFILLGPKRLTTKPVSFFFDEVVESEFFMVRFDKE